MILLSIPSFHLYPLFFITVGFGFTLGCMLPSRSMDWNTCGFIGIFVWHIGPLGFPITLFRVQSLLSLLFG